MFNCRAFTSTSLFPLKISDEDEVAALLLRRCHSNGNHTIPEWSATQGSVLNIHLCCVRVCAHNGFVFRPCKMLSEANRSHGVFTFRFLKRSVRCLQRCNVPSDVDPARSFPFPTSPWLHRGMQSEDRSPFIHGVLQKNLHITQESLPVLWSDWPSSVYRECPN